MLFIINVVVPPKRKYCFLCYIVNNSNEFYITISNHQIKKRIGSYSKKWLISYIKRRSGPRILYREKDEKIEDSLWHFIVNNCSDTRNKLFLRSIHYVN